MVDSIRVHELTAGPLSDTTVWGNPCVAEVWRSLSIVTAADVDDTICISIHFEWASMITNSCLPSSGPAWLICRRHHGVYGHSHGWVGILAGSFCSRWHSTQFWTHLSSSASKPGHHT